MPQRRAVAGTAALALGTCFLAEQAFVPAMQGPARAAPKAPALRGAGSNAEGGNAGSRVVALGVAGTITMAVATGRQARTARRAEPVTGAAAAAAAAGKAAAAVKGAIKTAGAVAGSAGAGSLKKSSDSQDFDSTDAVDGKKMMPQDRGSPEYDAYMAQKRKQKEKAWEVMTDRNPQGTFGNAPGKGGKEGDLYDPTMAASDSWAAEARAQGMYAGDFNPAIELGVTEPLGYFDPLGFCKVGNEEGFRQYRTAEIKHGRVAMMAALGAVAQHYVKFPGFEGVPAGLAAVNVAPGSYGFIALFVVGGALELGPWSENPRKEPGNFGDPLGLNQYTADMRNREINNGRAAMFAAIGIIAAELYTGKDAVEQLGF